ncbi:MAG: glycerate kinase [Bacteroidetes bacterium]|nr:glycerate kinase [Bacteroidota bacterium]
MHILIASDSFKNALPALQVCQAIEKGVKTANENCTTQLFPLADGGEGTAEILTYHSKGKNLKARVSDPLGRPVLAQYGISNDGKTAFIEMAAASGLQLLCDEERNPLLTSTFGTGELIKDALERGVEKILLGIGGSATNDAGMGMAHALGFKFLDEKGMILSANGSNLMRVKNIISSQYFNTFRSLEVEVLCDVTNPLFGKNGAAHVYAAQKGAEFEQIKTLDAGLQHFAGVVKETFGEDYSGIPGAGAAGGLGFGCLSFLNAALLPGIEIVMVHTDFEKSLQKADLVITGEGKIDGQTLQGKLIHGIAQKAKEYDIPVIALCGSLRATTQEIKAIGLLAAFSIINQPITLNKAIQQTADGLEQTAFQLTRVLSSKMW